MDPTLVQSPLWICGSADRLQPRTGQFSTRNYTRFRTMSHACTKYYSFFSGFYMSVLYHLRTLQINQKSVNNPNEVHLSGFRHFDICFQKRNDVGNDMITRKNYRDSIEMIGIWISLRYL